MWMPRVSDGGGGGGGRGEFQKFKIRVASRGLTGWTWVSQPWGSI